MKKQKIMFDSGYCNPPSQIIFMALYLLPVGRLGLP